LRGISFPLSPKGQEASHDPAAGRSPGSAAQAFSLLQMAAMVSGVYSLAAVDNEAMDGNYLCPWVRQLCLRRFIFPAVVMSSRLSS